ncbi:MAG: isochorismatase family protein [Phycisphaerales bacterium]|nr:isochorismatase family protein [Phycisphaerales bacterium]
MPVPRITIGRTVLLVIDVQERLISTIHNHDALVDRCSLLVEGCAQLEVPILVTEQYTRGLGKTVAKIASALPKSALVFEKTQFSAFTPEVRGEIARLGASTILVCGIEAHVCVLQSVLDACASGIQPFHMTDAISAGQADQIAPAFVRMERAGSIPSGALSSLYEMMGSCEHPAFRAMLPIAKGIVAASP